MVRTIDLNDLRLLMRVIEHGNYTAASRIIGIPKSTISQRIVALERAVGTGLLRRTSRSFSLTEAGARLLPQARAIEELVRTLEQSLLESGSELKGNLRVSCSNALAQFALSALVPRFLALHAGVGIRVEASNRLVDIVSEGFDMALRGHVGPLKDSSLRQRVVTRCPWAIVASRNWMRTHAAPIEPEHIPVGEVLAFGVHGGNTKWILRRGDERRAIEVAPRLTSDDMAMLRSSALADGGIACLPRYLLQEAIAAGVLVEMLTDWEAQTSNISVLTPPREQSSRLAAAFSDFLAAELPRVVQRGTTAGQDGKPGVAA